MRILLFILGVITALPTALLLALATFTPLSPSMYLYGLGLLIFTLGALLAPWRPSWTAGLAVIGLGLILAVAANRVIRLNTAESPTRLLTLPGQRPGRWINSLLEEQDAVLLGRVVGERLRMVLPSESVGLTPVMQGLYAEMSSSEGLTASPFAATYLGLQRPEAFDAVVIAPPEAEAPGPAIIFLHGFSGNFTLQCWMVAEAGRAVGATTVCPSVGFIGDWWNPPGEATLRATLEYVRQQGHSPVYLAGLSNGAVGACRLAQEFASEIAGLILISGADGAADLADLPALVIHGRQDARFPVAYIRAFARQQQAEYVELDSDHFVLAKQHEAVKEALVEWLRRQGE